MLTTDITPNDFDDAAALFERLAAGLTDMTPVFQDLGELLMFSTEERCPEGAGPDGTPWAPKSQATIEALRSREGRKKNAAIDFRPLFGPSGRLSSEIHYVATAKSVEIGSPLIYAAVQQFGAAKGAFGTMSNGASIPWGNIPARPFLGISEEDETGIRETLEGYLDQIAQSGN